MDVRDIVAIGASAGGVDALSTLVAKLPPDLAAAILVTVHVAPMKTSVLPDILSRKGPLPAVHPEAGERIEAGKIYVAPPSRHMLVENGCIRLSNAAKENGARPAIDPLFRSAARYYGSRVIGVILSGTLDDGTAGLVAIHRCGGTTIVQDPKEARFAGMPNSAILGDDIDFVLPIAGIADTIVRLANTAMDSSSEAQKDDSASETDLIDVIDAPIVNTVYEPGVSPSIYTCPECHGTLFETKEADLHFRCRVGHAYSPESLRAFQDHGIEAALWTAMRSLEESASLSRRLAARAKESGRLRSADQFSDRAMNTERHAATIRDFLVSGSLLLDSTEDCRS